MGSYTEFFENNEYDISPEDDNYTEELINVAKSFRSFDQSLDDFINKNGFTGDINNVNEKTAFIKSKFERAKVLPIPRNLKKWFTEHKSIERKTAFQFCFAFNLNIEESESFFRKICLQRGFDCHSIEEAIYYYAINNHLSYTEAQKLIEKAPLDKKGKIDFNENLLYTSSIIEEIKRFTNDEQLLNYFNTNLEQFGYNNATAYKYINSLWNRIASPKGLANREKAQIISDDKNFSVDKQRSVWDIYLQILGLDKRDIFALNTDRSLKPILKDNKLLHPLAEHCFPDRQGIEMILRGNHKSYELVRKTMILIVFYKFWISYALNNNDFTYHSKGGLADRCIDEINKYLIDSGYPALYIGNPYDWLFMYSSQDEYPLETFRNFINELYIIQEDKLNPKNQCKTV
ncbi:MAG: hypothetical protein ACI4RC_06255 [Oscillospiraceae bacterium]